MFGIPLEVLLLVYGLICIVGLFSLSFPLLRFIRYQKMMNKSEINNHDEESSHTKKIRTLLFFQIITGTILSGIITLAIFNTGFLSTPIVFFGIILVLSLIISGRIFWTLVLSDLTP